MSFRSPEPVSRRRRRSEQVLTREFDPGSESTLAACLTHASRAGKGASAPEYSGGRVSNTWVICPWVWNNSGKLELIPHDILFAHESRIKAGDPSGPGA